MVEGGQREDVPRVGGDDEGGDEINLVGGVGAAVAADRANVRMQALLRGAFDLDAEKASVVLDSEIALEARQTRDLAFSQTARECSRDAPRSFVAQRTRSSG